tara:strand:- start:1108 stop:2367 length:1260 start_codon:yes stop_codon:yes gene_type:complete
MKFSTEHALVPEKRLKKIEKRLQKEFVLMKGATLTAYQDDRAAINLCVDKEIVKEVQKVVEKKKKLKPKTIIVIGIGGSNLGTIAIHEAIHGKLSNEARKLKTYFLDTVDSDDVSTVQKLLGEETIVNVISKSGGTTETIALFQVLLPHLKKAKERVVVTTGEGSKLYTLAKEEGFTTLTIPDKVGGRYSVFSAVGLFPLAMMGVNIDKLLEGARKMRQKCLLPSLEKNPAALSAAVLFHHHLSIHDTFLFSKDLESVGKWYRQLMGESIGKELNKKGRRVYEGITPTVSIGSTDLHSLAQLYLGGPYDKVTTFVRLEKVKPIKIPEKASYNALISDIQGKTLQEIMQAIIEGTQIAFRKGKRPFMEITLKDKSEEELGIFLQMKMMEMMYLGSLLNVNPFNQPAVERYKIETKRILSK